MRSILKSEGPMSSADYIRHIRLKERLGVPEEKRELKRAKRKQREEEIIDGFDTAT